MFAEQRLLNLNKQALRMINNSYRKQLSQRKNKHMFQIKKIRVGHTKFKRDYGAKNKEDPVANLAISKLCSLKTPLHHPATTPTNSP